MHQDSQPKTPAIEAYQALALQLRCYAIPAGVTVDDARSLMDKSIEKLRRQVSASLAFCGKDTKLVVLPEYLLTGFPNGESQEAWVQKAALDPVGKEYDKLSSIAQEHAIFLAGNAYEQDPNFPDLFFQTCFVIDPSGSIVLRYRRMNSLYSPSPHDVWDRYLDIYGEQSIFPVAKTAIGNIGAVASEEILFPEVARCLLTKGVEVIIHSSSEIFGPQPSPKDICKQARAIENMVYVVSANTAGITNSHLPESSANGGSRIIDYRGRILATTGTGESMSAFAEIDLAALRRARRRESMDNLVARQRYEVYVNSFRRARGMQGNGLSGAKQINPRELQRETISQLARFELI
jgi:predicted amidohydrolase